jgi:2'-5' RNA ligase
MRLFIGIELDENVRNAVTRTAEALRTRLARAAPHVDARWVRPENLHVTVWFIGEANDERTAAIQRAFALPLATPRFTLSIAGCGAFPASGPPRVFWIGLADGRESVVGVYDDVAERMIALGIEAERRRYAPHLTIARVKEAPRAEGRAVREALANVPLTPASCRVEAATLFRSRLSPRGATYEPLLRVPLS